MYISAKPRLWPQICSVTVESRNEVKILAHWPALLAMAAAGILAACSQTAKAPDVSGNIRQALDQAGLKKVSITQDRDKGVVTLGGQADSDRDKAEAKAIATSIAGGQVVSNQIAVTPPGAGSDAKTANLDLDKGIESNLDAALIQDRLHESVHYTVKNSVVTLTGQVDAQSKRRRAETIAAGIPNVLQVVNEVRLKGQKIWRIDRNR
jgi:hyperosmotically inducible periplasmic protein